MTDTLMNLGIRICKVWFDVDLLELKIEVSNGISLFSNQVYVQHETLKTVISDLNVFKTQVYGGILDVCLGAFGPEYAGGAFDARFHFQKLGQLYITVRQQSQFADFPLRLVADEATIHLKTEPVLLDHFIVGLTALYMENSAEAYLEAIS